MEENPYIKRLLSLRVGGANTPCNIKFERHRIKKNYIAGQAFIITANAWSKAKDSLGYGNIAEQEIPRNCVARDKLDAEYIRRVCELPTQELKLILKAHNEKCFRRRADTIDAITSEIIHRELLTDG